MNINRWLLLGLAGLVALSLLIGRWLRNPESVAAMPAARTMPASPAVNHAPPPLTGAATPMPVPERDAPLPDMPAATVDAARSMASALEHGDPQAPRIVRDAPREAPTEAELSDPAAYQRYEARQTQRLFNQFVQGADAEIPRLQEAIRRAREAGLPPEQIAEGEEKLRRIQAMKARLEAGATAP